ncbi:MAG: hypothetical protein OEY15_09735 [Myxococcales bacterium]|nr:hypothetical protein [Myxococcales bacterium]
MSRATRRARRHWIAALAAGAVCLACADVMQRSEPDRIARHAVSLLQSGDLEGVRALVAPDALAAIEHNALLLLSHAVEAFRHAELRLVHHGPSEASDTGPQELWAYQLRGESTSILLLFKIRMLDGHPWISHVEWQPAPLDLRERFPFSLAGVPAPFHLILVAAVCVPLVMLSALFVCLRRRPRAWWLWSVLILLGIGRLTLIWLPIPFHKSYVRVEPWAVAVLGTRVEKVPCYDPWRVSVSLPLAALAFLWVERRRTRRAP